MRMPLLSLQRRWSEPCNGPFSCVLALWLALVLPAAAQPFNKSEPLAEVDGEAITSDEVEKAGGAPLYRLQDQIYALKRQKLNVLIDERLLAREAARRKISVAQLLEAEVSGKADAVSEQEVDQALSGRKPQPGGNDANARERVRIQLREQKVAVRKQAFLVSLRSQAKVAMHLQAPPAYRAEVSSEGSPFRGSGGARVTLVEFQDFHCPFCERVQPALAQLMERYGDRIKLVYRDFPIDQLHPQARAAHEAARCAKDQGKFWEYHDVLFARPKDSSPENLKAYAREAGLDLGGFERCVTERTYEAAVQRDIDDGIRAGVTGTPTFFVNGRILSGAQPLATFARLIDEELAHVQ
jgi:protein-disulfide isomerase